MTFQQQHLGTTVNVPGAQSLATLRPLLPILHGNGISMPRTNMGGGSFLLAAYLTIVSVREDNNNNINQFFGHYPNHLPPTYPPLKL